MPRTRLRSKPRGAEAVFPGYLLTTSALRATIALHASCESRKGGLVADSPFDEAIPLDGMVGSLEDLKEAPPNPKGVL